MLVYKNRQVCSGQLLELRLYETALELFRIIVVTV
jgi:hypothetical protein